MNVHQTQPEEEILQFSKQRDEKSTKDLCHKLLQLNHATLDIRNDIVCFIYYSQPKVYHDAAHQITDILEFTFPGMQVIPKQCHVADNMIEIRLRGGEDNGDTLIAYFENLEESKVGSMLKHEIPKIQKAITSQLMSLGFEFNPGENIKQILNQQAMKFGFSIIHPTLRIEGITCVIDYSGHSGCELSTQELQMEIKNHFPGVTVLLNKLSEVENIVDIRLRIGSYGNDYFIYYIEKIPANEIIVKLKEDLPKIVTKITAELLKNDFEFKFDVPK